MKAILNASVRSAGVNYRHAIKTGGHQLVADEPVSAGGGATTLQCFTGDPSRLVSGAPWWDTSGAPDVHIYLKGGWHEQ